MSEWIAVSRAAHADKYWRPRSGFGFARSHQLVPFIIAELAKLLPHYALGFVQNNEGEYQAVAMLGLGGEQNLFVNDELQWLCSYVPADLRAFPFALLDDDNGNKIFSIRTDHLSESREQPRLFNGEGELDSSAAAVFEFLSQRETGRHITLLACAELSEAGLIEPWPISIAREGNREALKINGLHRINEEALNKLDSPRLEKLRDSGALALAYGQLFSAPQVQQLAQRAETLAKTKQKTVDAGLDKLLGGDDAGSLNFDSLASAMENNSNK
ncbi:MAG: hypothetical protein CMQ34_03235 [Gammaproteobacteria bacterium]|nr:hypothetical protein [Gammaproteobacteria bacterium]